MIKSFLQNIGVGCSNIAGYGVIGKIYGKKSDEKSPTIGIRADIDALPVTEKTNLLYCSKVPGKMHACGHDMHTAILLGTAKILSALSNQLKGNVTLLFEPAEETIGGAKAMIEEGALKNPKISSVIGLHLSPEVLSGQIRLIEGTMNANSTEFDIEIIGQSCHGAHPEKGADSIVAAAAVILSLQSIVSRNIAGTDPAAMTIGTINGGTKENIIAGVTCMKGVIRSLDSDIQSLLKERVKDMASGVAKGFGCTASVSFKDSYPALRNNSKILETVFSASESVLGKCNVLRSSIPSLGADDFAYFCNEVPSLYFDLGCGHKDLAANFPLHSDCFNPDEECIKTGILTEVFSVLALIEELRKNG